MKFKFAFVNFFNERRGKRVVHVKDIEGFAPKFHDDFDDGKTYQVKWPHLPNEDSFSTEGLYDAKIVCLGVTMEDLQVEAKDKGVRIPSDLKSVEKHTTNKESGSVKSARRCIQRPKTSAEPKTVPSESIAKSHDPPPRNKRKKKMSVEDIAKAKRVKKVISQYHNIVPVGQQCKGGKDSPCSSKAKSPEQQSLSSDSNEEVSSYFVSNVLSPQKGPKHAGDKEDTLSHSETVDSPKEDTSLPIQKAMSPTEDTLLLTEKATSPTENTTLPITEKSPAKDFSILIKDKSPTKKFLFEGNGKVFPRLTAITTKTTKETPKKINKRVRKITEEESSTVSEETEYISSEEEKDTIRQLYYSKIMKLQDQLVAQRSTINSLTNDLETANAKVTTLEMEKSKLQSLINSLTEQLLTKITAGSSSKPAEGLETLISPKENKSPSPKSLNFLEECKTVTRTLFSDDPSDALPQVETSFEEEGKLKAKVKTSKKCRARDPREDGIESNKILSKMIVSAFEGKGSLSEDGAGKVHIGNNVYLSKKVFNDKISRPTVSPSIALRDAIRNLYKEDQLAKRSLEGGTPVKGDRSLKKQKMTPAKREALLGLYRAKLLQTTGNQNEDFLQLSVLKKGKETLRDKMKEAAKKLLKQKEQDETAASE